MGRYDLPNDDYTSPLIIISICLRTCSVAFTHQRFWVGLFIITNSLGGSYGIPFFFFSSSPVSHFPSHPCVRCMVLVLTPSSYVVRGAVSYGTVYLVGLWRVGFRCPLVSPFPLTIIILSGMGSFVYVFPSCSIRPIYAGKSWVLVFGYPFF